MKQATIKSARCAIYTRKSTEHGLDLEFNSLDAQREASEAYVKSQASLGWKLVTARYDDAAYSGGSLDRPALQKLLSDIKAGHIDVIVVYKIDRLTRSLADFAKLVEIFEKHAVSFVAVTQQFNTTTSMGRLTLNVLLSFAQFERELSSERVRDKFSASRKKGKWMGGNEPYGYVAREKRLIIEPDEAKIIRTIFADYLKLKSIEKLVIHLSAQKITTRKRLTAGRNTGGVSFGFGALAYLLKNQIYIGNVNYKGAWFVGEHEPILDRKTFDSVQKQLKSNSIIRRRRNGKNRALLTGLLFDDCSNRMSPSYTVKKGVRYRFYISSALLRGKAEAAGSVRRISATDLEQEVLRTLRRHFPNRGQTTIDRDFIEVLVSRVILRASKSEIQLTATAENIIHCPILEFSTPQREKANAHIEENSQSHNENLLEALIRAQFLKKMLLEGKSIQSVAQIAKMHPRAVQSNIRLAFLAPNIITSILRRKTVSVPNLAKFQNSLSIYWNRQSVIYLPR